MCATANFGAINQEVQTYPDPDLKGFSGMEGLSHVSAEFSLNFGLRSAEESFGITVFRVPKIVWAPIWHYQMFNGPIVSLT